MNKYKGKNCDLICVIQNNQSGSEYDYKRSIGSIKNIKIQDKSAINKILPPNG